MKHLRLLAGEPEDPRTSQPRVPSSELPRNADEWFDVLRSAARERDSSRVGRDLLLRAMHLRHHRPRTAAVHLADAWEELVLLPALARLYGMDQ